MSLSNQELKQYSDDHIAYEIEMINETAVVVSTLSGYDEQYLTSHPGERIKLNAFIESFLIHARNILDFLYKYPMKDDIAAQHYLKGWKAPGMSPNICFYYASQGNKSSKINKHLAHLTETRMTKGRSTKGWPVQILQKEINEVLLDFYTQVPITNIGTKLQKMRAQAIKCAGDSVPILKPPQGSAPIVSNATKTSAP